MDNIFLPLKRFNEVKWEQLYKGTFGTHTEMVYVIRSIGYYLELYASQLWLASLSVGSRATLSL